MSGLPGIRETDIFTFGRTVWIRMMSPLLKVALVTESTHGCIRSCFCAFHFSSFFRNNSVVLFVSV